MADKIKQGEQDPEVAIQSAIGKTENFIMENGNMSGSWEGVFESAEDGAQLHCTETINAKHWWLHPFVPGYLKRQQRLYLDDLRRELQK